MTNTGYQREPHAHASDASYVATIISGVIMVLAVVVQIGAIALPLWGVGGRFLSDGNIWEVPKPMLTHWIRAVQAFSILALLCGLAGVIFFIFMLCKSERIWSRHPLLTSEKVLVIGLTAALFLAGFCIMVAYGVITEYTFEGQGISSLVSLFSCILFLMGSGLSGKAAVDILFYRNKVF